MLEGRILDADLFKYTTGSPPGDGVWSNFMKALVVDEIIKKVRRNLHFFASGRVRWEAGERECFRVCATLIPLDANRSLSGANGRVIKIRPVGESPVESRKEGKDLIRFHNPGGSDKLNILGETVLDPCQIVITKTVHVERKRRRDVFEFHHSVGYFFKLNSGSVQGEVRCAMDERIAATASVVTSSAWFPQAVLV